MSRNPNEMNHGISADHYCSDMYPRGVMQSDYVVFQPIKKIEQRIKLTEQKPTSPTSMANKLCVICYCRLVTDPAKEAKLINLSCNHIFHQKCCKKWTDVQKVCPICRMAISDELLWTTVLYTFCLVLHVLSKWNNKRTLFFLQAFI